MSCTTSHRAVRALAFTIVIAVALSSRARAGELERIRTESPLLSAVMKTALGRSPTLRALVEQIEQSDVIVYLTCDRFGSTLLAGRTALAMVQPGVRYVRVQLACQQLDWTLAAILAHELQHVVEIASTASVVDARSLGTLYSAIGFSTSGVPQSDQFETMAALKTSARVRWELNHQTDLGFLMNDQPAPRASVTAD